jgi:hypothetical protein
MNQANLIFTIQSSPDLMRIDCRAGCCHIQNSRAMPLLFRSNVVRKLSGSVNQFCNTRAAAVVDMTERCSRVGTDRIGVVKRMRRGGGGSVGLMTKRIWAAGLSGFDSLSF